MCYLGNDDTVPVLIVTGRFYGMIMWHA